MATKTTYLKRKMVADQIMTCARTMSTSLDEMERICKMLLEGGSGPDLNVSHYKSRLAKAEHQYYETIYRIEDLIEEIQEEVEEVQEHLQ